MECVNVTLSSHQYKPSYQANFLTVTKKTLLPEKMIDYETVLLIDVQGNASVLDKVAVRYDGEVFYTSLGMQLEKLCYQRYLEALYTKHERSRNFSDEDHYIMYHKFKQKIDNEQQNVQIDDLEKSLLNGIKEEWIGKAKLLVKAAKVNKNVPGMTQNNAIEYLLKMMRLSMRDLPVLRYWSTGFWKNHVK